VCWWYWNDGIVLFVEGDSDDAMMVMEDKVRVERNSIMQMEMTMG